MATLQHIQHNTHSYQRAMLEIKCAFLIMNAGGSIEF